MRGVTTSMASRDSGEDVWVLIRGEYLPGVVVGEQDNGNVEVSIAALGCTLQVEESQLFLCNKVTREKAGEIDDLTALRYLHEPSILHVLKERAYSDKPYTFLSGILVSVNPLKNVDGDVVPGIPCRTGQPVQPHPYTLAEAAFQQLSFAAKNGKPCSQSIIIAGESGAGKTETSKRVLKHLIQRGSGLDLQPQGKSPNDCASIDTQLMNISPILESFGNAATLRNHNSSRFGKFTKLHFRLDPQAGGMQLEHASICSYLLERSRIVSHSSGERSFRVFYELIAGADQELCEAACLDSGDVARFPGFGFRYMTPSMNEDGDDGKKRQFKNAHDAANFENLVASLHTVGIGKDKVQVIMRTLGGILHLGNIDFTETDTEQGLVATINQASCPSSPSIAARLLGLDEVALVKLLIERVVNLPGGEVAVVQRKFHEAVESRDALAKSLYSAVFDWLLQRINGNFAAPSSQEPDDTSYVGVLDIFGFETFLRNDFEQLLINYANETLQVIFEDKVLVAESSMYRRQGIVSDEAAEVVAVAASKTTCLDLLVGNKQKKLKGILNVFEELSECPNPNDDKLLSALHRTYGTGEWEHFVPPHPKDRRSEFIIAHYAADVSNLLYQNYLALFSARPVSGPGLPNDKLVVARVFQKLSVTDTPPPPP